MWGGKDSCYDSKMDSECPQSRTLAIQWLNVIVAPTRLYRSFEIHVVEIFQLSYKYTPITCLEVVVRDALSVASVFTFIVAWYFRISSKAYLR